MKFALTYGQEVMILKILTLDISSRKESEDCNYHYGSVEVELHSSFSGIEGVLESLN